MHAASTTLVPPPPQNGYQPLSEAEIYAIKRQYLGLLPPQQVIDICLTFEANAPLHVKSTVWPYDIRAAIASILAQRAQASPPEQGTPSRASAPVLDGSSGENPTQPPASSSQQSTSDPAHTSASVASVSQPVTPQVPPATPGPHYPHQPYYHPTYPHTSYYTSSHAAYGYPHSYPSYPQPPALYPANPAAPHPPLFTNAPLVHSPHSAPELPPLNSLDDLPSYEEMIVEALLDSSDPEGCAPKNLFSWMAMHYPLQMNFRPSASQALQKAYKRGRLEKGNNGKYRLSEHWEGGNTSRRTTRRPQTLAQTSVPGPQPPSSPFTHAPLVPHGAANLQTRPPPPGQPPGCGGYPFGYPHQGIPGTAHSSAPRDSLGVTSQKQTADAVDHETGEGSDAWEAAQNILKAINFGQLFQISNEGNKAGESSTSAGSNSQRASADDPDKPSSAFGAPEEPAVARPDGAGSSTELDAEQRAALQAQLVLLAAQLAELADVGEDELSHNLGVLRRTPASDTFISQVAGGGPGPGDDGDSEDMVEVPVPTRFLTA